MHPHRETTISMFCDGGVILMKTISYIFTSLVACHVMTHQPLYFIVFYGTTVITWHIWIDKRKSRNNETHRGGIYFWKTIPLAHLFLCSAAPIQNYFSQFTFYTSFTCSDSNETHQHISHRTRALWTPSPLTHPHRLCSPTCKSPHSTWHRETSTHIGHAPCEWSPALFAHM